MPKNRKSRKTYKRRKNPLTNFLKSIGLISLVVLAFLFVKQPFSSSVDSRVLGEQIGPCQSGSLTTSTNKNFQMTYPDETFQQLIDPKNSLQNVNQLKNLTCLQYLDATDQTVKGDIADLKNLVNLEVFSLYSNPDVFGDICSLSNATKLRSLKFAFDPKITGDISCLKNLTKLETFAMTHTNIKGDISVFANMPNLKAIYVSGTYVKGNVCSLAKLTNLQELGIADEYPGNPDIIGDLSCLNNLKNLKRVSIYNTNTTNCNAFEKAHQGMDKTLTESGKKGGGGCSKESMKTLVDYAQKYEAKIGKDVQTEVRGQPNYNKGVGGSESNRPQVQDNRNIFQKIIGAILGIFGKRPGPQNNQNDQGGSRGQMPEGAVGPGGCKSQSECDSYCNKPEHQAECSNFQPPK